MKKLLSRSLRYLLAATLLCAGAAVAQTQASIDVHKNPQCGCCDKWVQHLQKAGFVVRTHAATDLATMRRQLQMPERLSSCHTARVGGYVIEGHVPAADIARLLQEKPRAIGLAVPAMPPGSPGMETTVSVPYETLLVRADGSTVVFARH